MTSRLVLLVAAWMVLVPAAAPAVAQTDPESPPTIDVGDLVAEPDVWDGERIALEGELVGDYSNRDTGTWVQLNDDSYARQPLGEGGRPVGANTSVGALIPRDLFMEVEGSPGRYGRQGPLVRLEGTFRHDDPRFSGETFLEVEAVSTMSPARDYATGGIDAWFFVGIALMGAAGSVAWRARRSGS